MFKFTFTVRRPALGLLMAAALAFIGLIGQAAAQDEMPVAPGQDIPLAPPPVIDSSDNHTPGTATSLLCGAEVYDTIGAVGEKDFYKIETGAEWSIVVTVDAWVDGSPLDSVITLYDANGTTVLADQDQFNGNDPRLHYTTLFNDPGLWGSRHYVRVEDFLNDEGGAANFYRIRWEYARYISMTTSGTIDGVAYAPGDILTWSGCGGSTKWAMFFDASDVGINGNVLDFAIVNGNPNGPYRHGAVILAMPKQTISGFGKLVAQDLAIFQFDSYGTVTTGQFNRFFDGSDVGLTRSVEAIDGVSMFGSSLALSTTGKVKTTGPVISAKSEDALFFSPSGLGTTTSGGWGWFFDGGDVGVPGTRDLSAMWISPATYFVATFDKDITLGGSVRKPSQATACDPGFYGASTSCTWGVSHQGLSDADLNNSGAVLDGYDEGSNGWPATFHFIGSALTAASPTAR